MYLIVIFSIKPRFLNNLFLVYTFVNLRTEKQQRREYAINKLGKQLVNKKLWNVDFRKSFKKIVYVFYSR